MRADGRRESWVKWVRREGGSRWWCPLAALSILTAFSAGCAGMPAPPPPQPAPLPDDSYSGGSNFGGPPGYFGPQV